MRPIGALSCIAFALTTVAGGPAKPLSRLGVPEATVAIGAAVVDGKGAEIGLTFFVLDCRGGDCALSTSTFLTSDRIASGASSASCFPLQGIAITASSTHPESETLSVSATGRVITTSSIFTRDGCDGLTRLKLEFELAPVSTGRYGTLKSFSGLLVRESDGATQAHIIPLRSGRPRSVDLPTLSE